VIEPESATEWLELTSEELASDRAVSWVTDGSCGAVTLFVGTVRDSAEDRTGVFAIDYEAYESPALSRLSEIAGAARARYPGVGRIAVWHRVGRVALGEASVVVAISAAHRDEAFQACRYAIDTVKETLPVWKLEHFDGGTDWSPASSPVRAVGEP